MQEVDQDFSGGMQSDFKTPVPNTFLEAWNFQLVSDEHNTWAFESVKGNIVTVSVTKNYRPIGFAKGTDKVILYSAYVGTNGNVNGEIAKLTFDTIGSVAYLPLYNHVRLNLSVDHMIGQEAYIYPENDLTEPSYFTDDFNPPRIFNHGDPIFVTYIASGFLVQGKRYMVLNINGTTDSISYNGTGSPILYGPNAVAGTVFTATNTLTYSNASGNCRVIEYYPVELLDWTPRFNMGNIRFKQRIVGNLLNGFYQYFYQVSDNKGFFSKWSTASRVVHVGTPGLPGSNISDYQALQGHPYTTASNIGNRMIIDRVDINYARIRVATVFYTDYQIPQAPVLIFDGVITGASMDIDHASNDALDQLSIVDIQQIVLNFRTVGSIASVNEIAFSAKITTEADFKWDPSVGATAKNIAYDVTADTEPCSTGATQALNGHGMAGSGGADGHVLSGGIHYKQWYRVISGNGGHIVYDGTSYFNGDVFQGVLSAPNSPPVTTYTTPIGLCVVQAIIRILRYGVMAATSPSTNCLDIPIINDYYDSKGQATDHYLKSNWRGETYRYAMVVFGTTGNPFYARWLADKTVAKIYENDPDSGFSMNLGYFSNDPGNTWVSSNAAREYLLRHIGTEFSNIDFNTLVTDMGITISDLPNYFSGFAIVRCPRDKTIITQGILWPTIEDGVNFRRLPQITNEQINDFHGASNARTKNIYCLYNNDNQVDSSINPSIEEGDQLEIEDYIYDTVSPLYGSPAYNYSIIATPSQPGAFFYNKFYKRLTTPPVGGNAFGTRNPLVAGQCKRINTGSTGIPIFPESPGVSFDNNNESILNSFNLHGEGARTMLLRTTLGEPGFEYGYQNGSQVKILVNVVRPKSVLYGGTGAAAKARNVYITTGHYQAFDDDFITYLNSTVGKAAGKADHIQVFGGDACVNIVDIARMMPDVANRNDVVGYTTIFPCEQNLNIALREGRHVSRDLRLVTFTNPEQYLCNAAYSSEEANIFYPGLPDNYNPNNKFSYRIPYSLKKIPGEQRNSFREYIPGNYKDVDGQRGEIKNIRTKGMRLFYWQLTGLGTLPVNERAIVSGQVFGAPNIIGEGGVAQRYDERTNFYGNQHKFGLGEAEDVFCWPDFKRRAYCYMNVGTELAEMSHIDGLMTEFNDLTGNFINNDQPLKLPTVGIGAGGISTQYDPRYKRMLTSFNFNYINDDAPIHKTLIFDLTKKQFGGWLNAAPAVSFDFNEKFYSIAPALFKPIQNLAGYVQNISIVGEGTNNYLCILSYTSGNPATLPSLDATHWQLVNSAEEIYRHYANAIGKFYNIVWPTKLKYPVTANELQNLEKIFDNHKWKALQNFFNKLIVTANGSIVATDVNLESNPEYEYRNKAWIASIPLDNTTGEQVQDFKMIVELIQDNTNPTAPGDVRFSSDKRIVLSSVITSFRKAY